MSMNRNNRSVTKHRFQLFRGDGEAERLDRFLAAADPLSVAAPKPEKRRGRSDRRIWSFVLFLAVSSLVPLLLRSSPAPAEGTADQALAQRESARLLVAQGKELLAEDRNDDALDVFSLVVQLDPSDAEAWSELASCQLRTYQSVQAERGYQRALSLEPDNQRALLGLGTLYLRQGKERQAEQAWLRGGIDKQLARLYLLQGKLSQAEIYLAGLRRRGDGDGLVNRMTRAVQARHLDPALRSYLEPEPTGLSAWAEAGWRLYYDDRYAEAASSFRRALASAPHDVNALSGMGSVLLKQGRPQEGRSYFDQALSLRGDHLRSLNGRGSCLQKEGKTAEAIAVWRKAVELYPGVSEASKGLAFAYLNLQDYRRAAFYLVPVARKYPHNTRVAAALDVAVRKIGAGP